jgi:hypothetical protein
LPSQSIRGSQRRDAGDRLGVREPSSSSLESTGTPAGACPAVPFQGQNSARARRTYAVFAESAHEEPSTVGEPVCRSHVPPKSRRRRSRKVIEPEVAPAHTPAALRDFTILVGSSAGGAYPADRRWVASAQSCMIRDPRICLISQARAAVLKRFAWPRLAGRGPSPGRRGLGRGW